MAFSVASSRSSVTHEQCSRMLAICSRNGLRPASAAALRNVGSCMRRRAGRHDDAVDAVLLDVLLDQVLARVGAHVLVLARRPRRRAARRPTRRPLRRRPCRRCWCRSGRNRRRSSLQPCSSPPRRLTPGSAASTRVAGDDLLVEGELPWRRCPAPAPTSWVKYMTGMLKSVPYALFTMRLVGLDVHLAQRARGDDDVGARASCGALEQLVAEPQSGVLVGQHHHAAAALGLGRVVDRLGADCLEADGPGDRELGIVEGAHGPARTGSRSSGATLQAGRARRVTFSAMASQPMSLTMTSRCGARLTLPSYVAPAARQRLVDLRRAARGSLGQVAVGLGQDRVAGVADDARGPRRPCSWAMARLRAAMRERLELADARSSWSRRSSSSRRARRARCRACRRRRGRRCRTPCRWPRPSSPGK